MIKFSLVLLGVVLFSSCEQPGQKSGRSESSQPKFQKMMMPEFDGKRAFDVLRTQTDFGPRNPNSAGHQKCASYLVAELGKYVSNVERQDFVHNGYDGEVLKLTNIFGAFNPTAAERILLLAHWDTRPRADEEKDKSKLSQPILGANDGASGVAVLMELARLFHQSPPPVGVDLLFVDGEDYGKPHDIENYFLGSRHFMQAKSPEYKPRFAILLDMVGDRDLQIPMEQYSMKNAPEAVELIWSTAERLAVTQFVNLPGEEISDDHVPLISGGLPTVDIIDFEYPYWHTSEDTPDKCSAESLAAVGKVIAHVVYSRSPQAH